MKMTERARRKFWSKVDIRGPDECWPWLGSVNPSGHGQAWWEGRGQNAHRVAYKLEHPEEDIDDLEIHHIDCETKLCCNPEHLESHHYITHRKAHLKTHCKRGHERTPENVGNDRRCKECKRQLNNVYRRKK